MFYRTIQGISKSTDMQYTPVADDEVEDLYELLKKVKVSLLFSTHLFTKSLVTMVTIAAHFL